MPMDQMLQLMFSGLTLGSIYALIALALVATFNITGVINLAQGEFVAVGALVAISLYSLGLPMVAAFLLAVLVTAALGGALERLAIHPARRASGLTLIIITIGLSITLRGLALLIWGTDTYTLPAFTPGSPLLVQGAAVTRQSLWVLGLALGTLAALYTFFTLTYTGKAVKAAVVNKTAARLVGISPHKVSFWAFVASGALGAAAGVFMAPITMTTYDMGFMLGLKGFIAAAIGGLGHVGGAVIGGLLLGLLEAYSAGLISSGLKDGIAVLMLLLVLMVRPQGLLGILNERKI